VSRGISIIPRCSEKVPVQFVGGSGTGTGATTACGAGSAAPDVVAAALFLLLQPSFATPEQGTPELKLQIPLTLSQV
jgi:hypothetical protein